MRHRRLSLRDSRIEDNRIERNNRRRFPHANGGWEEWAGIKLHNSNSVIRGNVVRDNFAYGIWIDNGYADSPASMPTCSCATAGRGSSCNW